MSDALFWHRLQFAFTIVYHYLFPQLTMGLALLIVVLKTIAARTLDPAWNDAARFWIRIFGINFVVGVVTGLPMEFQFGTNWAEFSRIAGRVVGHALALEGIFAFFLESSFLGLLLFAERRLGPRLHDLAAWALFVGTWLSGYFIIVTNAFMQHPVGHAILPDGTLSLTDFWAFLLNPWAIAAYAHNMCASVVTASFVMSAVGAWYVLRAIHVEHGRRFLTVGVWSGLIASLLVLFPTGDHQGKLLARHQPVALAAMEGRFESGPYAEITLIGQPNVRARRLDNPIHVPGALSFLSFGTFHAEVAGLEQFPEIDWPDNIELLYYSFHVMAGLGTLMIALMLVSALALWRRQLFRRRALLWALMLAFPFPYIATTAGWMTAELGRQPWLVYGILRTAEGASPNVHSGTVLFTLIGFCGLYFVLGLLFLFLVGREITRGPEAVHG
ncbi:MAG TPA: cytochrome ubiquinol oxidase subunit I [Candidatus Eisenbacteria bacterium]|nr:cytochrome ubiquinol oxidase subunit I [Candidatus Eisenbacteria bacterium]